MNSTCTCSSSGQREQSTLFLNEICHFMEISNKNHHWREEEEAILLARILDGFMETEVKGSNSGDDHSASEGWSVRRRDLKETDPAEKVGGRGADQMKMITWIMKTKKKWVVSATAASFFLLLFFYGNLFYSQLPVNFTQLLTASYHQTPFQTNTAHPHYPHIDPHPFTCPSTPSPTTSNMTFTCPTNYPPPKPSPRSKPSPPTCPDYFRWIHEDLKPWKRNGITKEMVEEIEKQTDDFRSFRLVIVNGTAYVKQYAKCYQTRDNFTLWGILQVMKMYPGQIPDLDLMFQCNDVPSVKKSEFVVVEKALPLFHYCGSDDTYDIVFPDWSFWGWPEINIKPWVPLKLDLEQGNRMLNWTDREPFAYWRGNTFMGPRKVLKTCNSINKWNAVIHHQDWGKEIRGGFKHSDMSKQCKHRYKIYMEGISWSVSEKYILSCDSMTLLVNPIFYDFFTRSLIPLKHFWPINPNNICESVKYAVDWGNHNPEEAQKIGRAGSRFVQEEIHMRNVYDYMFHVSTEYSKLLAYKPIVPEGAVELCSEKWVCPTTGDLERKYKMETVVEGSGGDEVDQPCRLPPPFGEKELRDLNMKKKVNIEKVEKWMKRGILMV